MRIKTRRNIFKLLKIENNIKKMDEYKDILACQREGGYNDGLGITETPVKDFPQSPTYLTAWQQGRRDRQSPQTTKLNEKVA